MKKICKKITTILASFFNKLFNYKIFFKIKRNIYFFKKKTKDLIFNIKEILIRIKKNINISFTKIKDSKYIKDTSIRKSFLTLIFVLILLANSFAWLYDEYIGSGADFKVGEISHQVIQYNEFGEVLENNTETQTIIYENNMSNITRNSKFIEVKNTGTLNMEFSMAFSMEGTIETAGLLYYRLYEVTDEVNSMETTSIYDTKIKAYAASNPIMSTIETDTSIPISNMSLLNNQIKIDTVIDDSSKYYRLDYGMYQTVNTSLYSNESFSVHMDVYSSQEGVITAENREGQIFDVQTEAQFRETLLSAIAGDTIKLLEDINIDGIVNISKRINLDTNDHTLTVNGDLIYEFVSMGNLKIDLSGMGRLIVTGNLYLNAPKAQINILGENKNYDMAVAGNMTVNAIQDKEVDGVFLENVRIVKNINSLIPIDLIVMSNTRLTIGPNVELGVVKAKENSTNIEIINNGNIIQINMSEMKLLDTFTKAQIYIYNLGQIYGVLGSSGIILPSTATPYTGPNQGNTLIIRGITSSDITVTGSDNFDISNITSNEDDVTVIPEDGIDDAYIIYIKDSLVSVESILTDYFVSLNLTASTNIANIKKLTIYTVNAQYVENEDFDYLKSDSLASLEYLNLANSKVIDGNVINRIKSDALRNKTTLKTVILPNGVTEIGSYAFYNVSLGYIPSDINETFNFLEIPSNVAKIESYAFYGSKYVKFKSVVTPTINSNAFSTIAKYFVIDGVITNYQELSNIDSSKVYRNAFLSDDRRYFVYETTTGAGISYIINNSLTGTSLGIPNVVTISGTSVRVTSLGTNSYREMQIQSSSGAALVLPNTVTEIESYAFYNLNLTSATFTNVIKIGSYAFYNTNIESVSSNNLNIIGNYAFTNSAIKTLAIENIEEIGDYAFANSSVMYEAKVGNVKIIGDYAFYDCKYMARFYINNNETNKVNNTETIAIEIGENALFVNWGYYIDKRLRMYVPDGKNEMDTAYLDLYKNLFPDYKNYIYIAGNDIGNYTYLATPYTISEYTAREITINNSSGTTSTGYEIISYQGNDLTSEYTVPSTLTVNGITRNVISIGPYAYINANSNGLVKISNNNLINIDDYAFYGIDISYAKVNNLLTIGKYAFYDTKLQTAEFTSLQSIKQNALSNISTLISLNLGTVNSIGENAVSNNPNLEQLYLKNTTNNITLEGTPFSNIGTNSNDRLRIYVPNDNINYYRTILPSYSNYIYGTGFIKGSYINTPINYDIGEYSVREVTKINNNGDNITGWELVEYHGANLTSGYTLPTDISVSDNRLSANLVRTGLGTGDSTTGWIATYYTTVTNVGTEAVTAWQILIPTTGFDLLTVNQTATGSSWQKVGTNLVISNSSTNGNIAPGASVTMAFQLKWLSDRTANVSQVMAQEKNAASSTLPLISIGENAFIHTNVEEAAEINITNSNILSIEKSGFENLQGIKKVELENIVTINSKAFKSSSITIGTFPNVKTIKSNAFNNTNRLYKLDIGGVSTLESNAISDAPYLYQILFKASNNNLNLTFASDAINNVGTSSNDRMRFYITNGKNEDGERYVDIYKSHFNSTYQSYFFSYDTLMGSYIPSGLAETIDIGEYTIRDVSLKNNDNETLTGYELVEYHGADLTRDYEVPTELTLTDSNLSASVVVTNGWGSYGNYTNQATVTVRNNGSTAIGTWRVTLDISSGGAASSIYAWGANSSIDQDRAIFTNVSYNGTIAPGGSISFSFQLVHTFVTLSPTVRVVREDIAGNDAIPIISIGSNAYSHSKVTTSSYFDFTNENLLEIGDSAFENNKGIRNVIVVNLVNMGKNAFKNASIFNYGDFRNLKNAGEYAFYNASNLAYLNLGEISEIKAGLLAGTVKMTQLYINNTNIDAQSKKMNLSIGENAFTNMGSIIGSKLRIYVPSGSISDVMYVDAYRNTISDYTTNIYETGTMVGSYYNSDSGYDIGQYSVMKTNVNGTTGFKIIEYHGDTLSSSYTFPTSLTINNETYSVISIGDYAYYHVSYTTGEDWNLNIPSNIKYIGNYAFYNRSIKTLNTSSMFYIGKYAFASIDELISVYITNITKIDEYAFYRNINLNTVSLGANVSEIGDFAFYNSWAENSLTSLYISTVTPPTIYENTLPSRYWEDESPNPTIYVPYASISAYNSANYWSEYPIESIGSVYLNKYVYKIINTNKISILNYIANEAGNLIIPEYFTINGSNYNVVSIASSAFDSTSRTTSITIPRYVVSVGDGFLENNSSIRSINVSSSNSYISSISGVLYDKAGTILLRYPIAYIGTTYTTPSSTKVIAAGAFKNVTSLTRINFNSGISAISETAFVGATNLVTLSFTGSTPPYLLSFDTFVLNSGFRILYPLAYETVYKANIFYNWYLNYLISN